jgi:hypothetical protein
MPRAVVAAANEIRIKSKTKHGRPTTNSNARKPSKDANRNVRKRNNADNRNVRLSNRSGTKDASSNRLKKPDARDNSVKLGASSRNRFDSVRMNNASAGNSSVNRFRTVRLNNVAARKISSERFSSVKPNNFVGNRNNRSGSGVTRNNAGLNSRAGMTGNVRKLSSAAISSAVKSGSDNRIGNGPKCSAPISNGVRNTNASKRSATAGPGIMTATTGTIVGIPTAVRTGTVTTTGLAISRTGMNNVAGSSNGRIITASATNSTGDWLNNGNVFCSSNGDWPNIVITSDTGNRCGVTSSVCSNGGITII